MTARVRQAQRRGELTATSPGAAVDQAANAGLITAADRRLVDEAEAAALETIQVDAFPADAPARRHVQPVA